MLEQIEFKNGRFNDYQNGNVMGFTNNTVVICNNARIMKEVADAIISTVNGIAEENDYWCDDEDVGAAVIKFSYGLQNVLTIEDQIITLGIEPALLYKAKDICDLWFIDEKDGLLITYPFTSFIGSHEIWESGKDEVYSRLCNGCFGCYDGSWVNLAQ